MRLNSRHQNILALPLRRISVRCRFSDTLVDPAVKRQELLEAPGCIYLDFNATTPISPEVAEAMLPFLTQHFGNASSSHAYGKLTRRAIDASRTNVAKLIEATPDEIIFTSCGTESNNTVLYSCAMAARAKSRDAPPHIVTSCIEHPAVLACVTHLAQQGLVTYTAVPVDSEGLVNPADVEAAITPETALVSIMHSNNEVGSLQPIKEIAQIARSRGVLMHTDAAQSMGRVPVSVADLGVDFLTVVGHKFGSPKGVAALYVREGAPLVPLLKGGSQERGRRGGTENILHIVGLGRAAELVVQRGEGVGRHMALMRDRLQAGLEQAWPQGVLRVNGPADSSKRLPNTLNVSIKGVAAPTLIRYLGDRLAISSGAACNAETGPTISAVIREMKVPAEYAYGTLRLSTGYATSAADVDTAVELVVEAAAKQGVKPLSTPLAALPLTNGDTNMRSNGHSNGNGHGNGNGNGNGKVYINGNGHSNGYRSGNGNGNGNSKAH